MEYQFYFNINSISFHYFYFQLQKDANKEIHILAISLNLEDLIIVSCLSLENKIKSLKSCRILY